MDNGFELFQQFLNWKKENEKNLEIDQLVDDQLFNDIYATLNKKSDTINTQSPTPMEHNIEATNNNGTIIPHIFMETPSVSNEKTMQDNNNDSLIARKRMLYENKEDDNDDPAVEIIEESSKKKRRGKKSCKSFIDNHQKNKVMENEYYTSYLICKADNQASKKQIVSAYQETLIVNNLEQFKYYDRFFEERKKLLLEFKEIKYKLDEHKRTECMLRYQQIPDELAFNESE